MLQVEKVLGEGGFGFVTKCCNTKTNEVVAIKYMTRNCHPREAALSDEMVGIKVNRSHPNIHKTREEIAILKKLQCFDPDTCNIIKLNGFFFDKDHTCLKFELLNQSLYKYIQCRYNNGLTTTELRPIIHQLATALYHLSLPLKLYIGTLNRTML